MERRHPDVRQVTEDANVPGRGGRGARRLRHREVAGTGAADTVRHIDDLARLRVDRRLALSACAASSPTVIPSAASSWSRRRWTRCSRYQQSPSLPGSPSQQVRQVPPTPSSTLAVDRRRHRVPPGLLQDRQHPRDRAQHRRMADPEQKSSHGDVQGTPAAQTTSGSSCSRNDNVDGCPPSAARRRCRPRRRSAPTDSAAAIDGTTSCARAWNFPRSAARSSPEMPSAPSRRALAAVVRHPGPRRSWL